MNVYVQSLFCKLSRELFLAGSLQSRGFHRLLQYRVCAIHLSPQHKVYLGTSQFSTLGSTHIISGSKPNTSAVKSRGFLYALDQRHYASDKQKSGSSSEKKSLVEAKENPYAHLTVGQKVKEVGKDASYTVVIVVGIFVTGLMFYMIGKELFSSQSPSGVYGDALKKCQKSLEVTAALGEPIKGYGETTRRGRRRHVSHAEFEVDGIPHMRLRFYIEGPYRKATVHVEVQKDSSSGKYDYRYLVVETEGYPHRTYVLEDNRNAALVSV